MKLSRLQIVSLLVVVVGVAVATIAYPHLPDQIPTHWNWSGKVDGYTAKPIGPFIGPVMLLVLWAALLVLPVISPKGFLIERFRRTYDIVQLAVILFLFAETNLSIVAGLGYRISAERMLLPGFGILLVVLGNYMGKITRNFFVGIRTPWTLASEEVWLRTHRLGGKIFVAAGLALVAFGLLGFGVRAMLFVLVAVGLIPVVYSYVIYRRIEGRSGNDDEAAPADRNDG
jgi:uncharacterized membrane protein